MFDRIYLIMLESFLHGFTGKKDTTGYGCGYSNSSHLGNLQGIIDAIPYIVELGMDSIWITPVFDADANKPYGKSMGNIVNCQLDSTAYFARDYFKIDPMFGTLEDYKRLVLTAHYYGLYIIMDFAIGHNKGNVKPSPNGLRVSEPVNFNDRETIEFFKEVFVYWIKNTNIDGFRLDQAYQAPTNVWIELRNTVATYNRTFFLGEILCQGKLATKQGLGVCNAVLPLSLEDEETNTINLTSGNGLNHAFDFGMMYRLRECIAGVDINGVKVDKVSDTSFLVKGLEEQNKLKPGVTLCGLFTNHDHPRLGNMILRGGFVNNHDDPRYWDRHVCAFGFLAQYPGIIQIFYNDELGALVPGLSSRIENRCAERGYCDDNMGRVQGRIDNYGVNQEKLRNIVKQFMLMRKNIPCMRSRITKVYTANSVLIALRGNNILFIMNLSEYTEIRNLPIGFRKIIYSSKPVHIQLGYIYIQGLSVVFLEKCN